MTAPITPEEELRLVIDHITLSVADVTRAEAFYTAALAPLGIEVVGKINGDDAELVCVGYGRGRKGSLWIAGDGEQTPKSHICFRARSREDVRRFYHAALDAGGQDNGPPGVREVYHSAYYAAFVLDPEGHNIEAVTFEPE